MLTPVPCLWALPSLPSPRPALELVLSLPSHPAEFQEVGFGPSQRHLRMELTREPRGHLAAGLGSYHCSGWLHPESPRCPWGKIPCDGGGAGMPWAGVDGHPAASERRVMPAGCTGGGWLGEQDPCRRRVTGSGADRQDRQRHLVARATSQGPGRGTRFSCLGPPGGLWPWLRIALEAEGLIPLWWCEFGRREWGGCPAPAAGAGLSCTPRGLHLPRSSTPRTLLCKTSPLLQPLP